MSSKESTERMEKAASILDQLLKYTEQLEASENDPRVDVGALSRACAERVGDLQKLIPGTREGSSDNGSGGSGPDSMILRKIRELQSRTKVCLDILEKKRNRAAAGLDGLAKAKRAIGAYNS